MSVAEILNKTGQRKLLALDGGGIRGIITIEILAKIEKLLQDALGRGDSFVLADYFDYIAGTSTGAIIATCISWGMRMDDIRKFYLDSGEKMFDAAFLLDRFKYKYEDKALQKQLQDVLKEPDGSLATLGSNSLKTLLLLIMRNATTDSPWPLSNNPFARYNNRQRSDCNLKFPLWQLVRASTAAPTFFPPEVIDIGNGQPFVFVDGGITMYNNPAFQLFLMATVGSYQLNWPTGQEQMLLVSIGTGSAANANKNLHPNEMNLLYNASSLPSALMNAAQAEQDSLCRIFGNCLVGDPIDREVQDLIGVSGPLSAKLFTYLRYNADISPTGLEALGLGNIPATHVQKMDSVQYIKELQAVGKAVADRKVDSSHFQGFLAP